MLISVETKKSLEQLQEAIPQACARHAFGVLGVHDLRAKLREKGVDYAGECLVFEVCNPHQAQKVLEAHPEVATALPCRISVFRTREGTTRLATIQPTALIGMFGAPELRGVAEEVEATLGAILREAGADR